MSNATTTERDEQNGQYTHALERVCRCGHRKGLHDAVKPWPYEEADCEGFKPARTKK
jgi:hypothetical protein